MNPAGFDKEKPFLALHGPRLRDQTWLCLLVRVWGWVMGRENVTLQTLQPLLVRGKIQIGICHAADLTHI